MTLLALAIAPGLAIILFIIHRDAYNKEPKLTLFISFLLGVLTIIPALILEKTLEPYADGSIFGIAVKAYFVVALVEEFVKFIPLRYYAMTRRSFDEPLDGIVYSVVISMGFATLENIFYVDQYGMRVAIMRMFMAVPAHAAFGVVMGYYAGKAKFANFNARLLLTGLLLATLLHGSYDFFLFLNTSPEVNAVLSEGLLVLGAIVSLIIGIRLSLKHIRIHRRLSQQTFMPLEKMRLQLASPASIALIRKMADTVWPLTYQSILSPAQITYMMERMYSEKSLLEQMKSGHEFVVAYDDQEPVGFASFNVSEPGIYKLQKIYVMPSQQGKGTGKFIIDRLSHAMKSKGGTVLRLNVNRDNKAKDFYEKIGFAVIREEDIDIGNGYFMNDYVLEKTL